jgi:hypothetical protein
MEPTHCLTLPISLVEFERNVGTVSGQRNGFQKKKPNTNFVVMNWTRLPANKWPRVESSQRNSRQNLGYSND